MGWEPAEVVEHEHEYDAWGNPTGIIRSTTTVEVEWDEDERQIMLDYAAFKRMTDRCGHHPITGMDPDVQRLVEHDPFECLDCTAIRKTREMWHKSQGHKGEVGGCEICATEVFWVEEHQPIGG